VDAGDEPLPGRPTRGGVNPGDLLIAGFDRRRQVGRAAKPGGGVQARDEQEDRGREPKETAHHVTGLLDPYDS
jgi:hypothetical protein